MLETVSVECPYCGEWFETEVDPTGGSGEYVEDCQICCQPIVFKIRVSDGQLQELRVERENE